MWGKPRTILSLGPRLIRLCTDGRNSFPMTHLFQMPALLVQGVRQLALTLQRPRVIGQKSAEDVVLNTWAARSDCRRLGV